MIKVENLTKIYKSKNPKELKIKTTWQDLPLEVGDIIYIKNFTKKPAMKKVNDEWIPIDGKFNVWINDYKKIVI